jgi:potassium-dependent mechanosensitive channel
MAIALIAVLLLFAHPGEAAEQKAEPAKAAAPAATAAISLAEIATQVTEVSNLLHTMMTQLAPSPEIEAIGKRLPAVSQYIDRELAVTTKTLREQPTLEELQTQQQLWQGTEVQTTGWLTVLTGRATELQTALNRLADLQKTWKKTRDAALASKAPEPIVQQIDGVIAAMGAAQPSLQVQRASLLDLQSRVAREVAQCGAALAQIAQAQKSAVGGILVRDEPAIWNADLWERLQSGLPPRVRQVAAAYQADIRQYVRDSSRGMPLHVGLFVALALVLCAVRREVDRWVAAGKEVSSATRVFDRPYAAALVGTVLVASAPFSGAPPMVRELIELLALLPMIRVVQPVAEPRLVSGLYALGILFALDTFRQAFGGAPLSGQTILLLETLTGIGLLGWSLWLGHLRSKAAPANGSARMHALRAIAGLVLAILGTALVAGAFGYMRLARLEVSSILGGSVWALALYAYVRVSSGVVAFALRVWPLRLLQMVQHHRDLLEQRIYRVVVWAAIAVWISRVLDYVGLLQPSLSLGRAILAARLERGSFSISPGDVLAFILTVWVAYLLSAFIRFALQEDVYPRIRLARGVSYAVSSLLNYVIIALGLVVGMALLGVNLSKVTILAGAFGIGIGFGLQSVVNNFVSGLILLFERPIHVGDTVEVGELLGEVRRIGIRASTVRTWRGADIIVPNAQLISERVTNWTLSDQLRRIDLPVGVNYGAEPKKVIEVLEAVARAHPRVLSHPPPQGLLTGYGDNSINFELRAWTDQFDNWPQIRSDLAVALYDAVHAAGMQFPFPQREVRLLHDDQAISAALPTAVVPGTSPGKKDQ